MRRRVYGRLVLAALVAQARPCTGGRRRDGLPRQNRGQHTVVLACASARGVLPWVYVRVAGCGALADGRGGLICAVGMAAWARRARSCRAAPLTDVRMRAFTRARTPTHPFVIWSLVASSTRSTA